PADAPPSPNSSSRDRKGRLRAPAVLSAALFCGTAMAKRKAHAERLLPQGARGALHGLYHRLYGRLVSGVIPQLALICFGPRTPCSPLFRFSRHCSLLVRRKIDLTGHIPTTSKYV